MKRAKLVLSAVAVLAVVGGAFAFKTARYQQIVGYYGTTLNNPARACTIPTTVFTTAANGQTVYFSTTRLVSNCPLTLTTTIAE